MRSTSYLTLIDAESVRRNKNLYKEDTHAHYFIYFAGWS